jgi:hypothetical protein
MQKRLRWLFWCLLAVVPFALVALVWIAIEDLSSDLRLDASRSTAIAYCNVSKDLSGWHIVIEEVWKNPPAGYGRFVGQSVPFKGGKSEATPDGAVVFFRPPMFSLNKSLEIGAIYFVNKGRVGSPDMSVSELKEICSAPPNR